MRADGKSACPIFRLPGVQLRMATIDVLHALDLGCTQDILGNIFWEFQSSGIVEGSNVGQRVGSLWVLLKKHYSSLSTPNRLQDLTVEMIKQDKKGPKLRAKGAETRGLVAFGLECAISLHEFAPGPRSRTILQMVSSLMEFYMLMDCEDVSADLASAAAKKCCLLYAGLSKESLARGADLFWRVKPKFHLWVELAEYQCEYLGNPKLFWAYRDEDFMGWLAQLGESRGGPKQASTAARRILDRWRCLSDLTK